MVALAAQGQGHGGSGSTGGRAWLLGRHRRKGVVAGAAQEGGRERSGVTRWEHGRFCTKKKWFSVQNEEKTGLID